MSRSQRPNFPAQATPRPSGSRPPPPRARTARPPDALEVTNFVARSTNNQSQIIIGSSEHCEIFAVKNLQKVKKDVADNTALIASKLTCKLYVGTY
jgi:hypothetical protein